MEQMHRRFSVEQVRVLLGQYVDGKLDRATVQETLGIGRSRFFSLLKHYRNDPSGFSIAYQRASQHRLDPDVEQEISKQLIVEKGLIDDKSLPISSYNYSAIRDRMSKAGLQASLPTIIDRAKSMGCHLPKRRKKVHDRTVVTTSIGALIQHDASHHRWSPYATERWVLITSIDDFSRKLLYAEFVETESTWAHIRAAEVLMRTYGLPFRYYVDSLSVFRFVQSRDSNWRKHVLQTDDADPQWRQVMRTVGVDVTFALSPQAKGKIERPYRWLQDRIVRTCAIEKLTTIDEARTVLKEEVDRYNNRQVHSTTGQIPSIRFDDAKRQGNTLFRPFVVPKPYASTKDVFCLHAKRTLDGYRKISLFSHEIAVPKVPLREDVEIHLIPDALTGSLDVRIWWSNTLVHSVTYPLKEFPTVHF